MGLCPTIAKALVGCVLLAALFAAGLSWAQPPRHDPPPDQFIEEHAERLGLDAETREAIRRIVEASRARGESLHQELRKARYVMRSLLTQETPEEAAVMRQAETLSALELEERKNRLRAVLQIHALLTPAQLQELVRIRKESHPRRRRGPMGFCHADIARSCPGAEPGRAAVQCLSEHWNELSQECQAVFTAGPHRTGPR